MSRLPGEHPPLSKIQTHSSLDVEPSILVLLVVRCSWYFEYLARIARSSCKLATCTKEQSANGTDRLGFRETKLPLFLLVYCIPSRPLPSRFMRPVQSKAEPHMAALFNAAPRPASSYARQGCSRIQPCPLHGGCNVLVKHRSGRLCLLCPHARMGGENLLSIVLQDVLCLVYCWLSGPEKSSSSRPSTWKF